MKQATQDLHEKPRQAPDGMLTKNMSSDQLARVNATQAPAAKLELNRKQLKSGLKDIMILCSQNSQKINLFQ